MVSVPVNGPGVQAVRNNRREARIHAAPRNMATAATYYWFNKMVRDRGRWDYKQFDPYFANFGNFNDGATGTAAGIPENILLMGAGYAQQQAGTSAPGWGVWYQKPPYGDDPTDQRYIREGIKYAHQNGY